MAKYTKKFAYEILTPAGQVRSGQAVSVIFPASDGEVGVLAERAPLVAAIGAGRLSIEEPGDVRNEWFVAGGFVEVGDDRMVVLAEQCTPADQLEAASARTQLEQAKQMQVSNAATRQARNEAIHVASRKLALAERVAR